MPNTKESLLAELVSLSHYLGAESREYVVVGEGNTSARIDGDTFWVKASGAYLSNLRPEDFVQIDRRRVITLLNQTASDQDVKRVLLDARVEPDGAGHPSVETTLHAVLYELTDARFIGHTHPTAVNVVVCSQYGDAITRHIIPDEIVVCGQESLWVPYTDPGVPLTREVHTRVQDYIGRHSEGPRVIYLQNHGMIALGHSARQVENVTAMAVKHSRVLAGALGLGEPHWLRDHEVARLHTRPDEEVRRARFE